MIQYGTVIDGALKTNTVLAAGIPIDMEKRTKVLVPATYTTNVLLSKFGASIPTDDMIHKFRERRPIPNWTTISVADAAGQSNIEVADPTYIQDDVVLWVLRDGERLMQLLVQDTSIDATVDVVNFSGATPGTGTLPVATEVGDIVVIGNEAHAEGEAVPDAFTNISIEITDYLMQIDRAVKKTDIEGNIKHYDDLEKKLARDLTIAWVEEKQKQNLAMWLGAEVAGETTSSTGRRRYQVKGLLDRLIENVNDFSGVGDGFTLQALQEILRETQDQAPVGGMKVLVSGVNVNNNISSWPDKFIRVAPETKSWGIAVNNIVTQYGEIKTVYDNTLQAQYGLQDRAVILEKRYSRLLHKTGLPVRAFMNITNTRDIHNMEHAISGVWGMQTSAVESMAQIKGVS